MLIDYRLEAKSLVSEVKSALELAIAEAKAQNLSITVRQRGSSILLWKVLKNVRIDDKVYEYIFSIPNRAKLKPTSPTVGNLLLAFTSLKQVKEHLAKAASDIRSISLELEQVDYISELYHCYSIADVYLRASRRTKRSKDEHFQEYCSLCWRLVHKYKRLNFGDEEYSNHYCKYHHPKKNDGIYHKDRRKVLSAIKKRNAAEDFVKLEIIQDPSTSRSKSARILYSLTSTFVESYRKGLGELGQIDGLNGTKDVNELMKIASLHYPTAYDQIKDINLNNEDDWGCFFKQVIGKLDPFGFDEESWADTEELSDSTFIRIDQIPATEWHMLLNILHRYQSFMNIQKIPQPRGPKKGTVAKNEVLRNKISVLATRLHERGERINASSIAREVGVSPQRVNKIVKELGLR
ncbi:TPA: hypothetical protein NG682_002992 [Vibrio parahaemolyticus]|uniref:hypothetical protein n=1 Tax=Vibrio parahaemolyticus TaxID=670 RepID=UPI00112184E7|nr:hypothetical protein [Vibrio parahaemolyticus]MDF4940375.1 hypothetical protein [Vibrio parahaemolyticus]TOK36573.1 hypothetical protein CGI20_17345 [Vibrio parahaemolyticus]HCE3704261.1 hypothetical protein [Vibrio parahaemolyticus]HCG6653120.1 hypothetical protein [Vibrio parahaemolyticus]